MVDFILCIKVIFVFLLLEFISFGRVILGQ